MGENHSRRGTAETSDSTVGRRPFLKATAGASVAGFAGLAGCGGTGGGDGGDGCGDGGGGGGGDGGGGTTELTFAGSTNGSSSFQAAIPWAEQVGQHSDPSIEISVQSTGGLDANVR